jgi:PEP-CTERM motif
MSRFASKSLAVIGLVASCLGAGASAQVLDAWKFQTPSTNNSNIGRLNLLSGSSATEQQLDGSGNVYVGAKFWQSGMLYSLTYTPDSTVGIGDVGAPSLLGETLVVSFANVVGQVTSIGASGFDYVFLSGTFSLTGASGTYVTGSVVGQGGKVNSTAIIGGTTGDSTFRGQVTSLSPGVVLSDSANNNLAADLLAGKVLFQGVTGVTISSNGITQGACTFASGNCAKFNAVSSGDIYLVQSPIPEPATAGLMLAGLAGLVGWKKRRNKR